MDETTTTTSTGPITDGPIPGGLTDAGPITAGPTSDEPAAPAAVKAAAPAKKPFRLHRSRSDKMLGGVCGGLAESLDVDAGLIRIGLVVLTVFGFGAGVLIYAAAWALAPVE
ncbi:PspC domain-containing protein [Pseudonocardia sp. T1-2H]|uniref:PspC domain-containing protein n=1 Tax=Pseudonocardia sp. T1-2H TaxID=3128899 RepID=UPI003101503A